MSDKTTGKYDEALDEQALQLLSDAPAVLESSPERMHKLRERVMQRVDDDIPNPALSFITVHGHEGEWVEIAPKIKKKVLYQDPETGTESYLLKAEPGAEAPPHVHEFDEHCVVLEGEVRYGNGVHLKAGDYHFAPTGSEHDVARTDVGVLVYIQTRLQGAPAVF